MNKLLPKLDELEPIIEEEGTFSHCEFTKPFRELDFQAKLQVVCDIVRQSMIFKDCPNPDEDVESLVGDCHTAALASIEYLKYLNIGKNHRYVLCGRRSFDPKDMPSERFAVIVEDDNNKEYFFDATPLIGYGYGKVADLQKEKLFENYTTITSDNISTISNLRKILYNAKVGEINFEKAKMYLNNIDTMNSPIYTGLLAKCYKAMANMGQKTDKEMLAKASRLNPYINIDDENAQKSMIDIIKRGERDALLIKQIDIWHNELLGLNTEKTDIIKTPIQHRQIELAQQIQGELIKLEPSAELKVKIDGDVVVASRVTPRWCLDNNCNVIMIKPSAYAINAQETIKSRMFDKVDKVKCEYDTNLGQEKLLTDIKPLNFSHSVGLAIERQMTGPANVYLVQGDAKKIGAEKKVLRQELAGEYYGKEYTWLDGQSMLWEKWSTNLVHSTDNPAEASLHFLIAYPEQQIMTRFMYPNPKLAEYQQDKVTNNLNEMEKIL